MIRRIGVVVPAADEEKSIYSCLVALLAAQAAVPCPVRIVVVLDACTDGTAAIVGGFPDVEVIESSARSVGVARRVGAEHLLQHDPDPAELMIASTDADSQVPVEWLGVLTTEMADADLVLGLVTPDDDLSTGVAMDWRAGQVLVDGHPHVHAANLAIRGSLYRVAGGWSALPTGEDHDLNARVVAAGGRVRRTARARVRTSTRAFGRAPEGFSSYLRALGHR